MFKVVKTYGHERGLSCAFRQWRAHGSHCSKFHGYAIAVELTFGGPLDDCNWVLDFGGLKHVKAWLEENFDHKTLVAADDPLLPEFQRMQRVGAMDLVVLPSGVGCERFAEHIARYVMSWLMREKPSVKLHSVKVMEHAGNAAIWGA